MNDKPADRWQLLQFPDAASGISHQVDHLFWFMVSVCAFVVALVFLLLLYFSIRFRSGSDADRTPSPRLHNNTWLEIGWAIPVVVAFLIFFSWGAMLYLDIFAPHREDADEAREINVVAKQWMWKFQHPEGIREINALHLPIGQLVRLRMTSQDVIHSFFVPAFRVKQDVLPQRYTSLEFRPTRAGVYHLFCAEYCGLAHSAMGGDVTVMQAAEFQAWLEQGDLTGGLPAQGEALFSQYGCSGCHGSMSRVNAPDLAGLFGKPVPLSSGDIVTADEQYLRDSIVFPASQVAAGYAPIMPSYKDQISEEDILKIIAYIRSLATGEGTVP